jgi:hypothetical protein
MMVMKNRKNLLLSIYDGYQDSHGIKIKLQPEIVAWQQKYKKVVCA